MFNVRDFTFYHQKNNEGFEGVPGNIMATFAKRQLYLLIFIFIFLSHLKRKTFIE